MTDKTLSDEVTMADLAPVLDRITALEQKVARLIERDDEAARALDDMADAFGAGDPETRRP